MRNLAIDGRNSSASATNFRPFFFCSLLHSLSPLRFCAASTKRKMRMFENYFCFFWSLQEEKKNKQTHENMIDKYGKMDSSKRSQIKNTFRVFRRIAPIFMCISKSSKTCINNPDFVHSRTIKSCVLCVFCESRSNLVNIRLTKEKM